MADWRGASEDAVDRGKAKDYQGMNTALQRSDIVADRMATRSGNPTKYPASQPEGYPAPTSTRSAPAPGGYTGGYRKGGMIMKKPVKGYQRGGEVKDTAPGAASASSRPWSANMAGRNVTMRNKGGKIGNLKKGKR